MGRFTRNDARSIIFNFVSPDVAETVETLYGTDDDLKNLDGHKFYRILMDAKNSTLSDPDTDAVMPVDTNFGAYRIYMYYKGLIWSVAKGTLVSEKLPDNVIATKEDEDGIMIKFFDNNNHVAATYITKDYMYENYMYDYMTDRIDRLILLCLEKLEKKA